MRTVTALLAALLSAALLAAPAAADERTFSEGELHQMLAPIALHPDGVLSNILIAATYPIEVVQAARWTRENPGLDGDAAVAAVQDRAWDPSVKALVAFPDILARMDEDLDWTQRLGEAFMFQEAMVMASIQQLRDRAYAAGNLTTNDRVRVVRDTEAIVIEPVRREIVYVPYYDTRVVYGPWWAPSHPPVYWAHPHGRYGGASFYWSRPVRFSSSYYYSSFFWPQHHVVVYNVHSHHRPQRWHHSPRRRPPIRHGDHTPPRRDAHREWADGRRETFPRGLRGPSRMPREQQVHTTAPQRRVAPAPARASAPTLDAGRPTNRFESRDPNLSRGPAQRRAITSQPPRSAPRATPPPTRSAPPAQRAPTPRMTAPTLDAGRPANRFESRDFDRGRMPAQRNAVSAPPRAAGRPAAARPAPAAAPARAARPARSAPQEREPRNNERER